MPPSPLHFGLVRAANLRLCVIFVSLVVCASFAVKASVDDYDALVGSDRSVVHAFAPAYPAQRPDISYGLLGSDVSEAQFFGIPTPGAANQGTPPTPASVQFSQPSGVFSGLLTVTLSTSDSEAEIHYSVDGSAPGSTNGIVYTGAIGISSTTRLRAVAVRGGRTSPVSGASFIKLAPELVGYTSTLPIMVIENYGAGPIRRKGWNSTGAGIKQVPRQAATWVTFDRVNGLSGFANPPQMLSQIGIRGRGAYSTEWRQKPYSVEAVDETGGEIAISPLGLPAHADWVLYFPDPDQRADPALLFNTFAYELSRNMGGQAVRFRWVEAFVNEDGGELRLADRRGVYAIMEKVSRGKERLDFQPLSPDGSSGSWLLNINRMDPEPETGWPAPNGATQPWFFHTAGPNRILETKPNRAYQDVPGDDLPQQSNGYLNFENPNGHLINLDQRAAIESWFQRFEDVLYDNEIWRDPVRGYRRYLDPLDFADYFILNVLTRNGDGLLISMFPWKGDDDKLRMGPAWDYNWNSYFVSGEPTGSLWHRSEQLWYPRLFADPDFKQLYIDRWWDLRRGPLSNAAMRAIINGQAAEITPRKSLLNGLSSTNEWTRRLTQMKDWLTQRADWIDSNYIQPPVFNQAGGEVPNGFVVTLTGTDGSLYVTTDGTDPRAAGGQLADSAQAYTAPLRVDGQAVFKARLKNGAAWSGLSSAVFSTPQDLAKLAVTEIMFDPRPAGALASEDLEFLELKNTGAATLRLGAFRFTSGIEYTFANDARLDPGRFFLLARNAAAIQATYSGVIVDGVYSGKLNNSGETIRLVTAADGPVLELTFNNRLPWPPGAAGEGYSAVAREEVEAPNSSNGADWRASTVRGGSPGADDPPDPAIGCTTNGAPIIVLQPLSQTVVAGAFFSLSVAVTNTATLPVGYRWQRNGEDIPGGNIVAHDWVCFLSITNAQLANALYSVHVTNSACPFGFTSASATLSVLVDADLDGQADSWESIYGLSFADPLDANLDSDGDGMRNWQEYVAGTNPTNAASSFKIDAVANTPSDGIALTFSALADQTYAVEFADTLQTPTWLKLGETGAKPFDRTETFYDRNAPANRFYRLVTPRRP